MVQVISIYKKKTECICGTSDCRKHYYPKLFYFVKSQWTFYFCGYMMRQTNSHHVINIIITPCILHRVTIHQIFTLSHMFLPASCFEILWSTYQQSELHYSLSTLLFGLPLKFTAFFQSRKNNEHTLFHVARPLNIPARLRRSRWLSPQKPPLCHAYFFREAHNNVLTVSYAWYAYI